MKTFLAIPINHFELNIILNKLSKSYSYYQWVKPENLHITLHFFGEMNKTSAKLVSLLMNTIITDYKAFNLRISHTLFLPNPVSPTAISYKVEESLALKKLLFAVQAILKQHSFTMKERKFLPHLTLARIKKLAPYYPFELPKIDITLPVNTVVLFESIHDKQGRVYKPIETFNLAR